MISSKQYYVYILTNFKNSVLYVGITSDLVKRIYQHQNHLVSGFTDKYNVTKLVYFEFYDNAMVAIEREKQIKNWHREWKFNLIKEKNPNFTDLYSSLL